MNNNTRTEIPLIYLDSFGRIFYTNTKPEKISVLISNPNIIDAFINTSN